MIECIGDLIRQLQRLNPNDKLYVREGNTFRRVRFLRIEPMREDHPHEMKYATIYDGGVFKLTIY